MLKGILSISGKSGLFKLVSQMEKGIIVESIETKKREPAYASHKISTLEDIAIFTEDEEVLLKDIFLKIKEKTGGKEAIAHKSPDKEIKKYFAEILPDYDEDRVYVSDMKKVFRWYNILAKHDMLEEKSSEEKTTDK